MRLHRLFKVILLINLLSFLVFGKSITEMSGLCLLLWHLAVLPFISYSGFQKSVDTLIWLCYHVKGKKSEMSSCTCFFLLRIELKYNSCYPSMALENHMILFLDCLSEIFWAAPWTIYQEWWRSSLLYLSSEKLGLAVLRSLHRQIVNQFFIFLQICFFM